jgi:hypothetical protein
MYQLLPAAKQGAVLCALRQLIAVASLAGLASLSVVFFTRLRADRLGHEYRERLVAGPRRAGLAIVWNAGRERFMAYTARLDAWHAGLAERQAPMVREIAQRLVPQAALKHADRMAAISY